MIETAYTMIRISLCRTFGWRFRESDLKRLLKTALGDFEIFGESSNVSLTSIYTADEVAYLQKRWLKKTLRHAKDHVPFYRNRIPEELIECFELKRLQELDITEKKDIKTYGTQFISDDVDYLTLYASSSGTTGSPTEFYISKSELDTWNLLQAITGIGIGLFLPGDLIQYNVPLSAQPDTFSFNFHCNLVGSLAIMQGIVPPEEAVKSLVKKRVLKGKERKVNLIFSLPSYLMKIVTTARALGYTGADFEVERIFYIGEVMPSRDRKEIAEFFGATLYAAYGSTEIVPAVATMCSRGNYHFDEGSGYVELLDVDTKEVLTKNGDRGVLTVTPYYPMRETMPTIRYWTNDMAEKISACGCGVSENGGVYTILGRADYNVRADERICTQLDLVEAATTVPEVARPVRVGVRITPSGIVVALQVTEKSDTVKQEIREAFSEMGLKISEVELHTHEDFEHIPLRSENEILVRRGDRR